MTRNRLQKLLDNAEKFQAWIKAGPGRWERSDGAVVTKATKHLSPEANPNRPNHRAWTAFGPGPEQTNYLGYYPPCPTRGIRSRMFVPIHYATAAAAILAVEKAYPMAKS